MEVVCMKEKELFIVVYEKVLEEYEVKIIFIS